MARPFKICPDCGAHLDASEPCDCKDAIEREPPKPWERLKLLAVCREVDKESGRVSVYPLDLEITSEILASLKMRAQFNPELRYFTTTTARWDRYGEVMAGMVTKGIMSVVRQIPAGAKFTVEVCNNGNDASPTWEDVTQNVVSGSKFFLSNTTKTASAWGYNFRIKVKRGTATGDCFITSAGGNFE